MIEIKFDNNSPEAYLVFALSFPFIKDEAVDDLDASYAPIVNNQYDMYRCADVCMNILKTEMNKHHMKIPDYYESAHLIIINRLLEEKNQQLNK